MQRNLSVLAASLSALLVSASGAGAQDVDNTNVETAVETTVIDMSAAKVKAVYQPGVKVVVVVDKATHKTIVLQEQSQNIVEVLSVSNATGKPATPTPDGAMVVVSKQLDPVWVPPASIDPQRRKVSSFSKNKHNPLGTAFIALNKGYIGLHGTNQPKQIGRNVSHGCVRHRNEDILKLYPMISCGTPVFITESLAQLHLKRSEFQTEVQELNLNLTRKTASHQLSCSSKSKT